MHQLPQPDLWSTFSPQTQRHLIDVWTELLGRRLQAVRGLPPGGGHEPWRRARDGSKGLHVRAEPC
jgi:hypothetical protein